MKDIVTKYRAVIEDSELLLGDNDNLKNMSRNDIDEICRYVIVDIYKESAELTIIALVNIYIKAMIVEANADYDILKEYVQEFLYYDGTTSSYRYIRAKLKEIKRIMEQGIDDKYLYENYEDVADVLEEFLEDLEKFSGVYKRMTKGDKDFKLIEYFHIKGNKQIRPLICAIDTLFMKNIINESVRNQSMEQLVNFFFLFNTTQQTSNRTDKIISSFSYGVYRCETVNEFKIIFTELLILLQNFIIDKNFKELFKNNSSFRYSNKNKLYSRNGRLVRYILSKMYDLNQQDTIINQSNISIEHLLSDDENGNNSFLWYLTLTSEEINCRELKNKDIKTKVQILKEKSTIKSNQELCNYMRGEVFDFEKRREDIMKCIFEKMFVFSTEVFHLTEGDCIRYREIEKLVKNDEHLMKILKKHGLNFEKHLNNNLELNNLKQRWDNIKLDS